MIIKLLPSLLIGCIIYCFLLISVDAKQPVFDTKNKIGYKYYLLNCSECGTQDEIPQRNGIYYIQIPVIYLSVYTQQGRYVPTIIFKKYTKEGRFEHMTTLEQNVPDIKSDYGICNYYKKIEGIKWTNTLQIHILSQSLEQINKINKCNIRVGNRQKQIALNNQDLNNFSFNLFMLDNSYELQELSITGPCFGDYSVYYASVYYALEGYDCDTLKHKYLKAKETTASKMNTPAPSSSNKQIQTTTHVPTKPIAIHNRNLARGRPASSVSNTNIFPNFGFVEFNKTIKKDFPTNASYIANFNRSGWKVTITPVKRTSEAIHIYKPSFDVTESYLFDSQMNLIAQYSMNKNDYHIENRYNSILPNNIVTTAKDIQNEVIHLLHQLNTIEKSYFNNNLDSTIQKIKKLPPVYSNYQAVSNRNYSGIKDREGQYILKENFYLQKTGHVWSIKDYEYQHEPVYIVLPQKQTFSRDKIITTWEEPVYYTRTNIYGSSSQFFFEVQPSDIVMYQNFIADQAHMKQKIALKLKKWFIIDGYYHQTLSKKLNLFKKADSLKKLIKNHKPSRFDEIIGRKRKETEINKLPYAKTSAELIDILINLSNANSANDSWEMHIFLNTKPGGAIRADDKYYIRKIESIQQKLKEVGIKRLHLWEFINRKSGITFYQSLADKISIFNDLNFKVKHQFITNSEDFSMPDQVLSKIFK